MSESRASERGHRFFRIIKGAEPKLRDFISNAEKGLPVRQDDAESRRLWTGISTYGNLRRARDRAWEFPHLGSFIAELDIVGRPEITFERTTLSRAHFTLWGSSASLLAAIVAVHPVGPRLIKEEEDQYGI